MSAGDLCENHMALRDQMRERFIKYTYIYIHISQSTYEKKERGLTDNSSRGYNIGLLTSSQHQFVNPFGWRSVCIHDDIGWFGGRVEKFVGG